MQNNLLTYLIYTLAVINILVIIRNFEICWRFDSYIRQDEKIESFKQTSAETEKITNILILVGGLFVITVPIKLQLFNESEFQFWFQLAQQFLILFLGIRLNILSTELLCSSACYKFFKALITFQEECFKKGIKEVEAKELFEKMPLPPWKTEPTTILILEPLLDRYYIKHLDESIRKTKENLEVKKYVTEQFNKK